MRENKDGAFIMTDPTSSLNQVKLKKACNMLDRCSRTADSLLREPMSLSDLVDGLHRMSKLAHHASVRISEEFFEATDILQRIELGNEYGEL